MWICYNVTIDTFIIFFIYLVTIEIVWIGNWAYHCGFWYNDISQQIIITSNATQCSSLCFSNPNCTHYVWVPRSGNNCWLKSDKYITKDNAIAIFNEKTICGIVVEDANIEWSGDEGVGCDIPLTPENTITTADCRYQCDNIAGCSYYSYNSATSQCSFFKESNLTKADLLKVNDTNRTCGIIRLDWKSLFWAYGCDFFANDLNVIETVTLSDCMLRCQTAIVNCNHFTYVFSDSRCYYKSLVGISQSNAVRKAYTPNPIVCGIIPTGKFCLL